MVRFQSVGAANTLVFHYSLLAISLTIGGYIIPLPLAPKKFQHYRHLVRLVVTSIPHLCSVRENRKKGGGFILANESGAFQSVRVSGHLSYSLFTIRY